MNQEFISHLIELRKRLTLLSIGYILSFLALFPLAHRLYDFLSTPLSKFLPLGTNLIATDITSPFLVPVKICALAALLISLPNSIYQIWQFIAPAMYKTERRLVLITTILAIILFICGLAFCYFLVLPAIFHFITMFKYSDITMLTDISKYLDFILSMFMIFGVAFETPILIFLLIHFDIVSVAKFKQSRKYIFVAAFIIAAIITPPDILSQSMLALALYFLFELGILIAKVYPHKTQS